MATIAEGFGRGTRGEYVQFLGYSLGSLDETRSHQCTAYDRAYLPKDELGERFREGTDIRKMTVAVHGSAARGVFSAVCEGDSPIFAASAGGR